MRRLLTPDPSGRIACSALLTQRSDLIRRRSFLSIYPPGTWPWLAQSEASDASFADPRPLRENRMLGPADAAFRSDSTAFVPEYLPAGHLALAGAVRGVRCVVC